MTNTELEINWAHKLEDTANVCDICNEAAIMECEVNINRGPNNARRYGVYCKGHYETLFDDLADELDDTTPPDLDDLDD